MEKEKEDLLKICISQLDGKQIVKIRNYLEKNKAEKHIKILNNLVEKDFFDFIGRMKNKLNKSQIIKNLN